MVALLLAGLWLIDWKLLMDMWEQEVSVIEMVFDLVKNFGINVTDMPTEFLYLSLISLSISSWLYTGLSVHYINRDGTTEPKD